MDNIDICNKDQLSVQAGFIQNDDSSNTASSSIHIKHYVPSIYQAFQNFYQKNRKTQSIYLTLNRMTRNKNISSEFYTRPLLKLLEEICNVLMMEELEISLWDIYLDSIIWGKSDIFCENEIWFAAYAAKKSLNPDLGMYNKILLEKNPNFSQLYEIWRQQHQSDLTIDPMRINETYNKLAKVTKKNPPIVLNYNYYMDDVLHTEITKKKSSGNNEDNIKKMRKLGKNKKKILSRDGTEGSPSVQDIGTVENEVQNQEEVVTQNNDMPCADQLESNDLDTDIFINNDWVI